MPTITRFGPSQGEGDPQSPGVTWIDVDLTDAQDRDWLAVWPELGERTRALLQEPVRLRHREALPEGLLLSLRVPQSTTATEDHPPDAMADLRVLIGNTRVVTARSGAVAAVEALRRIPNSGRSLATAMDLLAFLVAGMSRQMEEIIFDIVQDTDAAEDQLLDHGILPTPQALNLLRSRLLRARRQLHSIQQVLSPLATDPALGLDTEDRETLQRSANHVTRYLEILEDARGRIQMLDAQIEAQHQAMMTRASLNLTVVATVFLPLTFISGLLGMNVAGIPEEHNPYGFWVVTGVGLIAAAVTWIILRRRLRG